MKVREHKGSLEDSMTTVIEIEPTLEAVTEWVRQSLAPWGIEVEDHDIDVRSYGFDDRIQWDTYIVTLKNYGVLGFTDGPLGISIDVLKAEPNEAEVRSFSLAWYETHRADGPRDTVTKMLEHYSDALTPRVLDHIGTFHEFFIVDEIKDLYLKIRKRLFFKKERGALNGNQS